VRPRKSFTYAFQRLPGEGAKLLVEFLEGIRIWQSYSAVRKEFRFDYGDIIPCGGTLWDKSLVIWLADTLKCDPRAFRAAVNIFPKLLTAL
jgi:hypothetical protein